ncbi:hypothetical protein B0H16DRAFT_1690391 [Mycena metata]|uniref:Uncharacterized protein n=1 Tax=Mycena metata TaxID=1033252 RepID=A0AAD7J0Y9_9AGAR|nr:hypothetical protein B0H16DRAFT_1690391 [Mycena metata]
MEGWRGMARATYCVPDAGPHVVFVGARKISERGGDRGPNETSVEERLEGLGVEAPGGVSSGMWSARRGQSWLCLTRVWATVTVAQKLVATPEFHPSSSQVFEREIETLRSGGWAAVGGGCGVGAEENGHALFILIPITANSPVALFVTWRGGTTHTRKKEESPAKSKNEWTNKQGRRIRRRDAIPARSTPSPSRPATFSPNTTTGDKHMAMDEREREQAKRETLALSRHLYGFQLGAIRKWALEAEGVTMTIGGFPARHLGTCCTAYEIMAECVSTRVYEMRAQLNAGKAPSPRRPPHRTSSWDSPAQPLVFARPVVPEDSSLSEDTDCRVSSLTRWRADARDPRHLGMAHTVARTDTISLSGSFRTARTSSERNRRPSAVPDFEIQGLRLYAAAPYPHPHPRLRRRGRLRPWGTYALPPGTHDRLHAGRPGPPAVFLSPETEMFLPRTGCRRTPPGPGRMDGGAVARHEADDALRDRLTHLQRHEPPLRSRPDTRDKGSLRDGVHALRVPACARRATSSFSSSSHLVSVCIYPHGQAGGASTSHVGGGEPRMGTGTATGGEGDWERARDANGSMDVDLVGPLTSRWEEQKRDDQQSPRALRNVLASRADVHVRRPPTSTPSTPAPGHASSSSGPALPYRTLYAVLRGGDIRHAGGAARAVQVPARAVPDTLVAHGYCTLVTFDEILPTHPPHAAGRAAAAADRGAAFGADLVRVELASPYKRQREPGGRFHERRSPLDVCEHHSAVRVQKHPPLLLGAA